MFALSRTRPLYRFFKPKAIFCRSSCMTTETYHCDIDAEPLRRYRPGGYHPLGLGDILKDGRYKILHKLGWGGYSTTWAAKDQKETRYVSLKISVSDTRHSRELGILRAISSLTKDHPGWSHLHQLLDHFTLAGPNGTQDCLVLELLGPSVADVVESYYRDDRLPARLAESFTRQALQGLDCLARHGIGHGDIHTRNLAIEVPDINTLDEESFFGRLGKPEICSVSRLDGKSLASNVPSYIVRPAQFRKRDIVMLSASIKTIDFGEAFLKNDIPSTLHTPLPVRAPEVVFGDVLDSRVDLWSAGCLMFELTTGQPPFDVMMLTPPLLVQQMMGFATDRLPSRWQAKWQAMEQGLPAEDDSYALHEWLEEIYLNDDKHADFTQEDIAEVGKLISRMLKFEPSLRATASDILTDSWFERG
ncbi:hypothetical protein FZEAL_6400 [Fusarium zealandicum]|uniref:non-specific serine/threonine protein kinase n=1 Tax=Fusarium zealandicum TaxID=1053134 RepID=A0A8H4UIR1_9HYPO|nr:hypothetical protein FZEAL_6400 [Fusarium zealandicum]